MRLFSMQHYARALLDNPVETTCSSLDVSCRKWSVEHAREIWPYFAGYSVRFIYTREPTECVHKFSAYPECKNLCVYIYAHYVWKYEVYYVCIYMYLGTYICPNVNICVSSQFHASWSSLVNYLVDLLNDRSTIYLSPYWRCFPVEIMFFWNINFNCPYYNGRHLKLQLYSKY